MGDLKRRIALAALAGVLALSGCSAEPADEPAAPTAAAAETAAPEQPAGPEPVAYKANPGQEATTPENEQQAIASGYFWGLVTNPYTLSGQWTLDGNDHANTAKLWENYFSDGLKEKLTAAGTSGDVAGFGMWAVFALAPVESTDGIKASASCKPDMDKCWFLANKDGNLQTVDNPKYDETFAPASNQVIQAYDVVIPVSLTEQGNAEGFLSATLKLDLTFVENPTPGDGRPAYLIDSVNNELIGAQVELLTNRPDLVFQSE